MVTQERIQIITEFIQQGFNNMQKNIQNFSQGLSVTNKRMSELQNVNGSWNKRMLESKTSAGRLGLEVRRLTTGFHGFRMEMLGVLFFGMSMQRFFGGLIKTSLEWVGVTEIMSTTLGILFLPVAEMLLEWALKFLDWVSQLTPAQQKWIGIIVLTGIALGGLLMIIGTLVLGIGSMVIAFGGAITLIGTIGAVLGVAIIAIIGFRDAWKNNFLGMKTSVSLLVEGIKSMFASLVTFFKGVLQIIAGLFTLNFTEMGEGIKNIFIGIKNFIVGIFNTMVGAVGTILSGLLNTLIMIINSLLKVGALVGNVLTGQGFTTAGALQIPTISSPASSSSGGVVSNNVTYNVTVSDKREFEEMLRNNNSQLINETRRLIQT